MAKTWVLDTDTKGTGAEMVPLESALARKREAPQGERISVVRPKRFDEPPAREAQPRHPRPARFKIVDVRSRSVLAEDSGTRETVDALMDVHSIVDVRIYLRDPESDDWRPLTLRESKLLWGFRSRRASSGPAG
jgi:hypothetical protein